MSYRFKKGRSPAAEIRRVISERIQDAIASLRRYPESDVEGLHTARKDIKRIRSLLRLLRQRKLRALRVSRNRELRDTAVHLSSHRDREVLSAMMESWLEEPEVSHDPVLREAAAKMGKVFQSAGRIHPPLDPVTENSAIVHLEHVETAFRLARLGGVTWKGIRSASRHRALRMREARTAYMEHPDAGLLHEWRKQVKNHLYTLELLKEMDTPEKGRIRRVKRLEKRLGSVRDLDLLLTALQEAESTPLSLGEMGSLIAYTEHKKAELLLKAVKAAV